MNVVTLEDREKEIEFARRSAEIFAKDSSKHTHTEADIVPGCLLAMRWGLLDWSVIVMKLSDEHTPTVYDNIIREIDR